MQYNHVIIGSSPVCMMESLYSSQQGNKVCIVDDATELGGAWKPLSNDASGIDHVEIGCHILEKDRHVYRFLRENLQLDLVELDPQPKITSGKKWMRYGVKNLLFIVRDVKLYFKKHGFAHLRMNLYLFFKEIGHLNVKYISFQKASVSFHEKLLNLVNCTNIESKLKVKIASINVDTKNKTVELTTNTNEKISTDKLTISYTTSANKLIIDGKERSAAFEKEKHEFIHLHLHIRDAKLKKFTYLRLFKNAMVHRISDMSNQVSLSNHEHIICIGIYPATFNAHTKEQVLTQVKDLLKEMEIISTDCLFLNERWNTYQMNTTNFLDLKKLEKETKGLIKVIYTPDLTLGIRKNLHKFKFIKHP